MGSEILEVDDGAGWRSWLKDNHLTKKEVWLVFRKKGKSLAYDEALDEALAYGWIDSLVKRVDEVRYVRKFTPRSPSSIWSSSNINRVNNLTAKGRMTRRGLEAFARRTSKISQLERIDGARLKVPEDLLKALRGNPSAWKNFENFAPSHRKKYLIWVMSAKRPETRRKRIAEAVELVSRNVKDLLK